MLNFLVSGITNHDRPGGGWGKLGSGGMISFGAFYHTEGESTEVIAHSPTHPSTHLLPHPRCPHFGSRQAARTSRTAVRDQSTSGALDMGGASTQITFVHGHGETVAPSDKVGDRDRWLVLVSEAGYANRQDRIR